MQLELRQADNLPSTQVRVAVRETKVRYRGRTRSLLPVHRSQSGTGDAVCRKPERSRVTLAALVDGSHASLAFQGTDGPSACVLPVRIGSVANSLFFLFFFVLLEPYCALARNLTKDSPEMLANHGFGECCFSFILQ